MAQKITMNGHDRKTVAEVFDDFVISQTAQRLTEVTLTNYRRHFHSSHYVAIFFNTLSTEVQILLKYS